MHRFTYVPVAQEHGNPTFIQWFQPNLEETTMTQNGGPCGRTVAPTDRTRLRRYPERASYARDDIDSVLDEALICHLGFTVDGQPYVIPTMCTRVDDFLYLHGSAASRTLKTVHAASRVCLTASLVDGLVLARSAFAHSLNYRSVVVLGPVVKVEDEAEKMNALKMLTNALIPNRWDDIRPPTPQELKATTVLRMPLREASLKWRSGPPSDLDEDLTSEAWSGVIPLEVRALPPVPAPTLRKSTEVPDEIAHYTVRQGPHPFSI
uniref:Flavin-nucleotide-binding protein n=1 Tax=Rhodococcus sp. NS1 TaxID=402236 RepID=A0A097SQQ9_9NOCA|nr:hypothetical protein LRS1606.437 [Rhodococcus sp. NS1]